MKMSQLHVKQESNRLWSYFFWQDKVLFYVNCKLSANQWGLLLALFAARLKVCRNPNNLISYDLTDQWPVTTCSTILIENTIVSLWMENQDFCGLMWTNCTLKKEYIQRSNYPWILTSPPFSHYRSNFVNSRIEKSRARILIKSFKAIFIALSTTFYKNEEKG